MATQKPVIRPLKDAYSEVEQIIIEAVAYGYNRAHKHTEHPTPDQLRASIVREVMNQLGNECVFGWRRVE